MLGTRCPATSFSSSAYWPHLTSLTRWTQTAIYNQMQACLQPKKVQAIIGKMTAGSALQFAITPEHADADPAAATAGPLGLCIEEQ